MINKWEDDAMIDALQAISFGIGGEYVVRIEDATALARQMRSDLLEWTAIPATIQRDLLCALDELEEADGKHPRIAEARLWVKTRMRQGLQAQAERSTSG